MPKKDYPLAKVYALLEPGPVVLLTTFGAGRPNVMTMSWHCMMEFEPPLVGCVISSYHHSFGLLQANRQCVINIPTAEIAGQVVGVGNCSGAEVDKFARFGLTPTRAEKVKAPLIAECCASLECRVADTSLVDKYCFFILRVVKAWVDPTLRRGRTLHHLGYGKFMLAGETVKLRSKMR